MGKSIETQEKTLQLVNNELNARIDACYEIATNLKKESNVSRYFNVDFSSLDEETANSVRTNAALSLFSTIIFSNDLIRSCCLIRSNKEFVIQNPYAYAINDSFIEKILKEAVVSRSTRFLKVENGGKTYYCLYSPVYQRNSPEYSHLIVLINDRFVSSTILRYKRKDDSFVITDEDGYYVYYSDYRMPGEPGFDVFRTIPSRIDVYKNSDKLVLATRLNRINWSVSLQIPNVIVFEELYRTIATTAAIIMTTLILVFAINFLIVRNFNKRVQGVIYAMERIKAGDLDYRYEEQSTDEISKIGQNLNNMVDTLNNLVKNISSAQLQKKEAQLNAIQRQINPHFLYNTLETIRMVALYNRDHAAARITKALADLFRYNMGKEGQVVSVEQELNYTLKYIDIQKARYKEKFIAEIDIDPLILQYSMLRTVLQPFVENAIFHGIEPSPKSNILLRLSGRMEGQEIILQVQDEGIGICPETLEQIRKCMKSEYYPEASKKHLGIINVNERLKLFFNIKEPVFIESLIEKGTTVTLRFPALRYSEE